MKKERKRRICNYFMKALLLCALVFGFGFIAGVDVNAGEEHSFYVDESGSIKPSSSITVSKSSDSTHSFTITNKTAKPVKITLDNNVTPKSKNYRMRIKVGGHECVAVKMQCRLMQIYFTCIQGRQWRMPVKLFLLLQLQRLLQLQLL